MPYICRVTPEKSNKLSPKGGGGRQQERDVAPMSKFRDIRI